MGLYDDEKCPLATYVSYDTVKHACNHDDNATKIEIRLKTRLHAIHASRFVTEYIFEGASVCDVS